MSDVDELLLKPWHVVKDDVTEGWTCSTSEVVVAMFVTEEQARHISDIHNEWLSRCHRELQWHVSPHRGCMLR